MSNLILDNNLLFLHSFKTYTIWARPLILTLKALVDVNCLDRDMDSITHDVSYLRNLFHAIKKAEDAIDDHMTHVSGAF